MHRSVLLLSVAGLAVLDILDGHGYVRAIVLAVLLPCVAVISRFERSDSENLRFVARMFWSLLAGGAWSFLAVGIAGFLVKHIGEVEIPPGVWWLKFVMAAVFLSSVALFYQLLLRQERRANEDLLSDIPSPAQFPAWTTKWFALAVVVGVSAIVYFVIRTVGLP